MACFNDSSSDKEQKGNPSQRSIADCRQLRLDAGLLHHRTQARLFGLLRDALREDNGRGCR